MTLKIAAVLCAASSALADPSMSIISMADPSMCLDLLGERTQDGTPINLWKCTAGLLGQQWFFDGGSYKIRSGVNGKKCVDAGDMKNGTELKLKDCDANTETQYFGWDATTNAIYATPEKGALKSTSMCLKIGSSKVMKGNHIVLTPCKASDKLQQWTAQVGPPPTPSKNETFTFSPGTNSKMCLDLKTNASNGNPVELTACVSGKKSQEWIFAEGSYRIASVIDPEQCIDSYDRKNGTHLMMWKCNGFSQQQWGYQQTKGATTGTVYLTQPPQGTDPKSECLSTASTGKQEVMAAQVGECIQWQLKRVNQFITIV